jgi:hypothetical protein
MGGGQIGWRQQINTWVLGLEGDLEGSSERGSFQVCSVAGCPVGSAIGTADLRLRWLSTLRGTVGFLVHPKILLYGTGGLAIGQVDASYLSGINGGSLTTGNVSTTRVGYSVGAGVEGKIDQHWSVRGSICSSTSGASTPISPPRPPPPRPRPGAGSDLPCVRHQYYRDHDHHDHFVDSGAGAQPLARSRFQARLQLSVLTVKP